MVDIVVDKDDVKCYHELEVNGKIYEVPEPTPRTHKTWQKVLKHQESRVSQNIETLCQVEKTDDYKNVVRSHKEMVKQIKIPVKSKERAQIMKRMLILMIVEDYVYSQGGKVYDYLKDTRATIDDHSDGLWLEVPTNPEGINFLEKIGTQRITLYILAVWKRTKITQWQKQDD